MMNLWTGPSRRGIPLLKLKGLRPKNGWANCYQQMSGGEATTNQFFYNIQIFLVNDHEIDIYLSIQEKDNKKTYIEEYLKEYFQIQNVFKYTTQNQRIFCRYQQLQQIKFFKLYQNYRTQLQDITFVENLVIEQTCLQKIQKLKEVFIFYFIIKYIDEDNNATFYKIFQSYSKWIQDQFNKNKSKQDTELLKNQIDIINSQYKLQQRKIKDAFQCLKKSLIFFKNREYHSKVIQCQILLAECYVLTSKLQPFNKYVDYYQANVVEKAQILGQQLKGVLYADSLWRISQILWYNISQNDKPKLLQSFTAMAITQMSRCKGAQFIDALKHSWEYYDAYKLTKKPQIKPNINIKSANLKNLKKEGAYCLSLACWKNITTLNLINDGIGEVGCQYLSKADWKNINTLFLSYNQIGDVGCQHLSKADWKNITTLKLGSNEIGNVGCQHLSKAIWKNITVLDLELNKIGDLGCLYLSKADWKNMTTLNLNKNKIGAVGCQYLSKADWKNMTSLNLNHGNIGDLGCLYLSKADWKNMTTLNLEINNIGAVGCQHLSKADWKNITTLNFTLNNIGDVGCQFLSKADWKKITILNLSFNDFGDKGYQHLSKANWPNLQQLFLNNLKEKNRQQKDKIKLLFTQKDINIKI